MRTLAIETSCDETAAAIVEGQDIEQSVKVLSLMVASSEEMHIQTGGVVPEVAAREQVRAIIPVIQEALRAVEVRSGKWEAGNGSGKWEKKSHVLPHDLASHISRLTSTLDAIAVTVGPGLIGSLLVGVETAKTLAFAWGKPLVPINHLVAHLYANFVSEKVGPGRQATRPDLIPKFPAVGLVVSGGHTDLVLMKDHGSMRWLGGTRDDAAGECFDKGARILGLPYPGGPAIAAEAAKFLKRSDLVDKQQGPTLPRPLIKSKDYDFSFSGLKTAVARLDNPDRVAVAYELQEAIVEVLVERVMRAVEEFRPKSVLLGGGVAANLRLREQLNAKCQMLNAKLFMPNPKLCTDNAVTIGAAAYYNYAPIPWEEVRADPSLEIA